MVKVSAAMECAFAQQVGWANTATTQLVQTNVPITENVTWPQELAHVVWDGLEMIALSQLAFMIVVLTECVLEHIVNATTVGVELLVTQVLVHTIAQETVSVRNTNATATRDSLERHVRTQFVQMIAMVMELAVLTQTSVNAKAIGWEMIAHSKPVTLVSKTMKESAVEMDSVRTMENANVILVGEENVAT